MDLGSGMEKNSDPESGMEKSRIRDSGETSRIRNTEKVLIRTLVPDPAKRFRSGLPRSGILFQNEYIPVFDCFGTLIGKRKQTIFKKRWFLHY